MYSELFKRGPVPPNVLLFNEPALKPSRTQPSPTHLTRPTNESLSTQNVYSTSTSKFSEATSPEVARSIRGSAQHALSNAATTTKVVGGWLKKL